MRKYVVVLIVLVNITMLFFNGCIPAKPTEDIEILPSERLINRLEVNRRKIKSFEGAGTIQIKSSQINSSATFRVILQKPDSLFFTIMGPFNIELAQALVTKENFYFYNVMENVIYSGDVDSDVLKQIFKVNLTFSELMDAFIGSVNLTENLYKTPTNYTVDYDEYVLSYVNPQTGITSKYRVDIRELGIKRFEISDENGKIIEGKYSRFELLENVAVPYQIEITNERDNQLVIIDYKKMSANNKGININFEIPDDAAIIKW